MHIETRFGEGNLVFHKKAITNPWGWRALIPTGQQPTVLSFPNHPTLSEFSYEMNLQDLQVGAFIHIRPWGTTHRRPVGGQK